ncbi:MAG: waaF [Herminiimonas sp.]|nr:waaF [Herminiimonas sp.]
MSTPAATPTTPPTSTPHAASGTDRTLVISPNWIGDAVMAQPLLQLLKTQHPERAIDVVAPAWVAPVWRAMVEVDTVLTTPFRHGALQLRERLRYAGMLRDRGYADAYVLPNTWKYALLPWLAGIPKRVGYRGEMRYGLLNAVHRNNRQAPRPMVSFYAALANPPSAVAPLHDALPRPRLHVGPEQRQAALELAGLASSKRLVVFAPGAEFGPAKRWPTRHFAELAKLVWAEHPDIQIALLGSGKDKEVCSEIAAMAPQVHDLAGVTSLDVALALIAEADAVVSNDSGLLHIASAFNRPVVALYGPTDPQHAPPFSDVATSLYLALDCAPCRQRVCPLGHHNCMRQLAPQLASAPLLAMLASR